MSQGTVRMGFELRGRDPDHLNRRVQTFREAIRVRGGAIVDIQWTGTAAQVQYEIPVRAS